MSLPPLILDTNLLALLVVGITNRGYVRKHKRLQTFDEQDYDILAELVALRGCLLTPNVVSETSNIVRYIADPMKGEVAATLRRIVEGFDERFVESRVAVAHRDYSRLGATDAALLELAETGGTLLTDDLPLYLAAAYGGLDALNYNHIREARPDFR